MAIRDRLTRNKDFVLLDGVVIGSIVRYGKRRTNFHTKAPVQTAFASRIHQHGVSIEEEGKTMDSVLNKVAARISKAIRTGTWPAQPTDAAAPNLEPKPGPEPSV